MLKQFIFSCSRRLIGVVENKPEAYTTQKNFEILNVRLCFGVPGYTLNVYCWGTEDYRRNFAILNTLKRGNVAEFKNLVIKTSTGLTDKGEKKPGGYKGDFPYQCFINANSSIRIMGGGIFTNLFVYLYFFGYTFKNSFAYLYFFG
jgi:hypothetical protein